MRFSILFAIVLFAAVAVALSRPSNAVHLNHRCRRYRVSGNLTVGQFVGINKLHTHFVRNPKRESRGSACHFTALEGWVHKLFQ